MVVFNECRIDQEGKYLIIDISVKDMIYYKKVYLRSITIHTDETFEGKEPIYTKSLLEASGTPQTFSSMVTADGVFEVNGPTGETTTEGQKNVKLRLSAQDLNLTNLNDNMLLITVEVGGTPDPTTPCGMDNIYTTAIAVNLRPLYNMAMNYIKELGSTCNTPKGFIDMILRLKAFELSLKTGHYKVAIGQWGKFFKNMVVVTSKGCGCDGTN